MKNNLVGKMPDEPTIRRYLLNQMTEPEQIEFEEQYFADYPLFERVEIVEAELIEDYARHKLAGRELEWFSAFEKHYLATPARRERIGFAQDLVTVSREGIEQKRIAEQMTTAAQTPVQEKRDPWWKVIFSLFSGNLIPVLSTAVALLFLTFGIILYVQNQRLRNQLDETQAKRIELEQLQQQLQQQLNERNGQSEDLTAELERVKQELSQLKSAVPKVEPSPQHEEQNLIARLLLAPGDERIIRGSNGKGKKLVIPPGAAKVKISIFLDTDEFQSFQAIINPVSGGKSWESKVLKAEKNGKQFIVTVPADIFTGKDYFFILNGVKNGTPEENKKYSFEVVRKKAER